ncbi:MAG: hypothetical protein EP343_15755 [Deltaproteobacteria bacterium]|nr:MAG: hypothetical protein EP343_15755 [Deltaproteobacteria bacterium]
MYTIAKRVKIVAGVLMLFSLVMMVVMTTTMPFELVKDDRIQTVPPKEVMQLTQQRVALGKSSPLFVFMVPSSLQSYPAKAIKVMKSNLATIQTTKDAYAKSQAIDSLRHHSKLIFDTVEGQIRKSRNAALMITFGMGLMVLGGVFLFIGWLRVMFSFLVVGMFCVCLPIKDQWLMTPLVIVAPVCAALMVYWLVNDNPAREVLSYNSLDEHI